MHSTSVWQAYTSYPPGGGRTGSWGSLICRLLYGRAGSVLPLVLLPLSAPNCQEGSNATHRHQPGAPNAGSHSLLLLLHPIGLRWHA